jgi:hypothetical protein
MNDSQSLDVSFLSDVHAAPLGNAVHDHVGDLGQEAPVVWSSARNVVTNLDEQSLLVLDPLAFRNVARHLGEQPLSADRELRNLGIQRELVAVLAQPQMTDLRDPMRRAVSAPSGNRWTCCRWVIRKRSGMRTSSGNPIISVFE